MLPQRTLAWLIWGAVLLSACSVLFFRCFLSLDGPVHVLHAAAWGDVAFGPRYAAGELRYDMSAPDFGVLDAVAALLVQWCSAETTEMLLAALVLFVFCGGAVVYARTLMGEHRWGMLLVLPLSFNVLLIFGFFPFLFGVGVCFWAIGTWLGPSRIGPKALALLALAVLLCLAVHRGALPLLALMFLLHEGALALYDRARFAARWGPAAGRLMPLTAAVVLLALVAYAVHLFFLRSVSGTAPMTSYRDFLRLRPWLLVHDEREMLMRLLLGAGLLALLVVAAMRARRLRPSATAHVPLVGGMLLLAVSVFVNTPWTAMHYVAERAQVVGVLLLVVWAVAMFGRTRWMLGAAMLALVFHVYRTLYLEHRLAYYAPWRASAAEVAQHLEPGSLVVAQRITDDWLLQHCLAPVMVRHHGVVISRHEKLPVDRSSPGGDRMRRIYRAHKGAMPWIRACVDDAACPDPRHVLLFGADPHTWLAHYPQVERDLQRDYTITASAPYWMVWTRR